MLPTNHSVEMDLFPVTQNFHDSSLRSSNDMAHKPHPTRTAHRRDYAIGIAFILIVTLLWTLGSFVTQDLYESGYNKPFLVTYANMSMHVLCLILVFCRYWWNRSKKERKGQLGSIIPSWLIVTIFPRSFPYFVLWGMAGLIYSHQDPDEISGNPNTSRSEHPLPPLSTRQTLHLACVLSCVSFIGFWTINASLALTTVASATILSSISTFFTLVIGRVFRVETLGLVKIGAVIMSFAGVLLVSLSDSRSQSPTTNKRYLTVVRSRAMLGDVLALISALFGAIWVILMKVRIKDESRVDMQLLFGLVGLCNILFFWPIGIILHLTGAETFELPRTKQDSYAIMINMAITVFTDYLCTFAMLKTTPLVFTVGISLTIPFAVVAEFLRKTPVHGTVVAGAIVVITSFVAIGLDNSKKVT